MPKLNDSEGKNLRRSKSDSALFKGSDNTGSQDYYRQYITRQGFAEETDKHLHPDYEDKAIQTPKSTKIEDEIKKTEASIMGLHLNMLWCEDILKNRPTEGNSYTTGELFTWLYFYKEDIETIRRNLNTTTNKNFKKEYYSKLNIYSRTLDDYKTLLKQSINNYGSIVLFDGSEIDKAKLDELLQPKVSNQGEFRPPKLTELPKSQTATHADALKNPKSKEQEEAHSEDRPMPGELPKSQTPTYADALKKSKEQEQAHSEARSPMPGELPKSQTPTYADALKKSKEQKEAHSEDRSPMLGALPEDRTATYADVLKKSKEQKEAHSEDRPMLGALPEDRTATYADAHENPRPIEQEQAHSEARSPTPRELPTSQKPTYADAAKKAKSIEQEQAHSEDRPMPRELPEDQTATDAAVLRNPKSIEQEKAHPQTDSEAAREHKDPENPDWKSTNQRMKRPANNLTEAYRKLETAIDKMDKNKELIQEKIDLLRKNQENREFLKEELTAEKLSKDTLTINKNKLANCINECNENLSDLKRMQSTINKDINLTNNEIANLLSKSKYNLILEIQEQSKVSFLQKKLEVHEKKIKAVEEAIGKREILKKSYESLMQRYKDEIIKTETTIERIIKDISGKGIENLCIADALKILKNEQTTYQRVVNAIETEIDTYKHLLENFGIDLYNANLEPMGQITNEYINNATPIDWDNNGTILLNGRIQKAYSIAYLENDEDTIVFITNPPGRRSFAPDQPLLPGGTLELKHLREIKKKETDIRTITLQTEMYEETHGNFSIISGSEELYRNVDNPKTQTIEQNVYIYKVKVKAISNKDNSFTNGDKDGKHFTLNLRKILNSEEYNLNTDSTLHDIKYAIAKEAHKLEYIDTPPSDNRWLNESDKWYQYFTQADSIDTLAMIMRNALRNPGTKILQNYWSLD